MLKLAAKHYLKSIGDTVLVPNPDYTEFNNSNCLDVVIKRRPRFFWQNPVYTYDNFGLSDLLDVPLPDDLSTLLMKPEQLNQNYKMVDKVSLKGKMGPKIADIASIDISGEESLSLSIDFQDMMKQSINYLAVRNLLKSRKVDLRSKYISRLAQDKYNVICLITQYIYITKPTTIIVDTESGVGESGEVTKAKCLLEDSGSYKSDKQKTLTFGEGTKLAFEFSECLILADGSIELLDRSEPVRKKHMIAAPQPLVVLPNYCAHITFDNQSYDIPDSATSDSLATVFQSLIYLFNDKHVFDIKKMLLNLALRNKNILKKLELFILHCQQEKIDIERRVDSMMIFDEDMLHNDHLVKFFRYIDLPMKDSVVSVQASALHPDLLQGVLYLIHNIYQLEHSELENIHYIVSTHELSKIEEIIFFLQSVKFLSFHNNHVYERMAKDAHVKRLLRTLGVTEGHSELSDCFEPILILLYGQR